MPRRLFVFALILVAAGCMPAATGNVSVPVVEIEPVPISPRAALPKRPLPYPVNPPADFARAVERGTRTLSGAPGPRYWQNWTDYRLRTRLYPREKRLEGSAEIAYRNNSPDTLRRLVIDLDQNLHMPGVPRNEPAEVTGGVELRRVAVGGRTLAAAAAGAQGARYTVEGTKMTVVPPSPVLPNSSVKLQLEWAFAIPQAGAGARMGYSEDNLFFVAYWYPQMAVYDDVGGWHPDPFLGNAEFYSGFGSYDVSVEAPAGWVVMGTGRLVNPEETLAPAVLERLRLAERSDSVVQVLAPGQFANATAQSRDGWLRWHFRADSVRDVAFSATRASRWDAARTPVGDRDGDGAADYTRVDAFYREPATRWTRAARYAQHSIDFLSRYTGYPYPWPHMTAVEGAGIIGGGMEYPMMTLIGDYTRRSDADLYNVVAHELAHMWVPMIVGTDERRYAWLDEGTTSFNENQARKEFFPGAENPDLVEAAGYLRFALAGMEGEMMRRSDFHYSTGAYGTASYPKPATVLVALRGLLGEDVFLRAYRLFIDRWAFKHPQPWDLWNTFEQVSGQDLDWFWRSWYFETWTLDQAVGRVDEDAAGTTIVVRDLGDVPMPARLAITLASGEVLRREIPVQRWLAGDREATLRLPAESRVQRVEIDPEQHFPDVNRANNIWVR